MAGLVPTAAFALNSVQVMSLTPQSGEIPLLLQAVRRVPPYYPLHVAVCIPRSSHFDSGNPDVVNGAAELRRLRGQRRGSQGVAAAEAGGLTRFDQR